MKSSTLLASIFLCVAGPMLAQTTTKTSGFVVHNLVSDLNANADLRDPVLVNPWGIAFAASGPFWIVDNKTGVITLYDTLGRPFPVNGPLVVKIPGVTNATTSTGAPMTGQPTSIVFNNSAGFEVQPGRPAAFLFAGLDGIISGWNAQANLTTAIPVIDNSASGAIYTGMAIVTNDRGTFLVAANFHSGRIDVFNSNFFPASLPGTFNDAGIPFGFAPFNVQAINGKVYVTYAKQNANRTEDEPGAGNGFISVFDTSGRILQRLVLNGSLNSPWGVTLAPAGFGNFGGALLVGNFGDGTIHAFDPTTGIELGVLTDQNGKTIKLPGLWALMFGNGGNGGDPNTLYFSAGIPGSGDVEDHGLFGSITAATSAKVATPTP